MKKITQLLCLLFLFLMTNCQVEEDIAKSELSHREELFFKNTSQNKASHIKGMALEDLLKIENKKSGFLQKLSDQKGLPIWDKVLISSTNNPTSKNSANESAIAIPLTVNNRNLSSLLFVSISNNEVTSIKTVTNQEAFDYIYNPSNPKAKREQLTMNFV
jgi:hypothetical protein